MFDTVWDFLKLVRGDRALAIRPTEARRALLSVGDIIYIKDDDSRLDNRVMLVLRDRDHTGCFGCLAMCRHYKPFEQLRHHWRVMPLERSNSTAEQDEADVREAETIEVRLHLQCPGTEQLELSLEPKTTINLWSLWNVEDNVNVTVLGSLTAGSRDAIGLKVAELVWSSLPGSKERPFPEDKTTSTATATVAKTDGETLESGTVVIEPASPQQRRRDSGKGKVKSGKIYHATVRERKVS